MLEVPTASPRATTKNSLLTGLLRPGVLPVREANSLQAWATTFYPFQREWLFEVARFAMCLKSRQIGMSHTTAAVAVLWAMAFAETTTVISVGEREATEVVDKAKKHATALQRLGSKWAECEPKAEEIRFANGGRIIALPSSTGGRSFSGNVFIDEIAYLQRPEEVWDGASAVAMHGGRIRTGSTPNGVGNLFHKLWTDPKSNRGWARHEFPLKRAIADGMKVNIDDCWKMAHGDERLFAQLFECSFLDGELQYIPTQLVDAAICHDPPIIAGQAYAGLDIGLENDLTVLTVVKTDRRGHVWVQEVRTCKRTAWEDQMSMILASFDDWEWTRLAIDATGMGAVPAQLLQKALGRNRIEPVNFSLQSKEILATGMYQRFADRTVHLRNDEGMVRDLCALRRIVTTAGNVRYDAPRTADGHADRAWSLALALHACSPLNLAGTRSDYGDGDFRS